MDYDRPGCPEKENLAVSSRPLRLTLIAFAIVATMAVAPDVRFVQAAASSQDTPSTQDQPAQQDRPADHGEHAHGEGMETAEHGFEDVQKWVERFESPERDDYQMPDRVIEALGLEPGQTAADIGAGTGYFTFRLARAVAPDGKVHAVDIEPGMVDFLNERMENEEAGNLVEAILADPADPLLPDGTVDLILLVNTYHHIPGRVDYLLGLKADLAPRGRIVVIDFNKKEIPVGPPKEHKMSRGEVIFDFESAGYRLVREKNFLPYQYFLVFRL
jgi:ubiquinone/menaquinone biosynthesis C-methylase UbiE